jgi:diguanylate cyclase (GGDEF)-like protein
MKQAMAQAKRQDTVMGVAFLDLDGFKEFNDNYGHDKGDMLLKSLSNRMKEALREGDTLARIGGDEFVALLLNISPQQDDHAILSRLLDAVAEPVRFKDIELKVSASVGVTLFPQKKPIEAEQLIRQADQAMYIAKQTGKNRYKRFDETTDHTSIYPQGILARLRQALIQQEFTLYYQPKVNMRTGQVIGAEALIRWRHPEQGLLKPANFIPALAGDPLAVEVGDWVLEQATNQISTWRKAGYRIPVSVNIDATQLNQPNFFDKLSACLERHPHLEPGDLELEILENNALEDVAKVAELITTCDEIGIGFSLDDFGTGYSTLSYLKQLPARLLKIDRSFVKNMQEDAEDLAVLDGVIGLADAFRRETIAEGVETVAHGAMLLSLGCHLAQGYGIAEPMPPEALPPWIKHWRPDPIWTNRTRVSGDDLPVLFAIVEHRAWIERLRVYLRDDTFELPPLDPNRCRVGRWLNDAGLDRYSGHPALKEVDCLF